MKKILLFILVISILNISCTQLMEDVIKNPQKWVLVRMTGSFANSETTGEDMAWQEYYEFNTNQTFTRVRIQNGSTKKENGNYSLKEDTDGTSVYELTYNSTNDLIGNCTGNTKEYLNLSKDGVLFNGGWAACDGPGLYYSLQIISDE